MGTKDTMLTAISPARLTGYSDVVTYLTWNQLFTKVCPPPSLISTTSRNETGILMLASCFCWTSLLIFIFQSFEMKNYKYSCVFIIQLPWSSVNIRIFLILWTHIINKVACDFPFRAVASQWADKTLFLTIITNPVYWIFIDNDIFRKGATIS